VSELRALVRTSWFRLALLSVAVQAAVVVFVLAAVYQLTAADVDRRTDAALAAEIDLLADEYARRGLPGLVRVVADRSGSELGSLIYLVATPRGQPVAGNLSHWPADLRADRRPAMLQLADPARDGRAVPVSAIAFTLTGGYRLLVGVARTERVELQRRIETSAAWILGLTLVLGLAGGVLVSRRAMRQVERINGTAARIVAGDLRERVPLAGTGDELDRLARNLNGMLDRIEHLMAGMRQVTDAVAHDMRTPLTRLRTRLERAAAEGGDPDAMRRALEESVEECDRLLAVFRALLGIAEAEAASGEAGFAPVDLGRLAEEIADLYGPAAEEAGISIHLRVPVEPVAVLGSRELLAQAAANLADNAVKHTPRGGRISLAAEPDRGEGPALVVADTGPGIPEADRGRVLQRFVRLDASRGTPGHGLGLSLVEAVARRHGARLVLEDAGPGLRAVLRFPRTGRPPPPPP
jgi:signal transduction histidine kinase